MDRRRSAERLGAIRISKGLSRCAALTLAGCALLAAVRAPPAAAQCGQRTTGYPSRWTGGGPPPLVVGDSILYDVVPSLARLGFQADAMVCRQFSQGLMLLAQRGASLPHLVVLELGTNGTVTGAQIDQALAILGPHRLLGLITPHDGVVPSDIGTMLAAQRRHPRQILILDWNRLASAHPYWLSGDGIHLSGEAAIAGFAQMVATLLPYAPWPPCLVR